MAPGTIRTHAAAATLLAPSPPSGQKQLQKARAQDQRSAQHASHGRREEEEDEEEDVKYGRKRSCEMHREKEL